MAHSVSEYFLTNYTKCQREESFLASWQGLAYISHSIGAVALPIQLLTAWFILTKTPKNMMSGKWILLNSHVWCSLYDMMLSSFLTPYFFFPSLSGFTVGLFSAFRVPIRYQLICGFGTTYIAMISMLLLFENRSSLIFDNRFRMKRTFTRIVWVLSNVSFNASISIPFLFMFPDQEQGKLNTLKMMPCPTAEFFLPETFVLTDDLNTIILIIILATLLICIFYIQLFFFSFCCFYYLYLVPNAQVSSQTQKLQKRFFIFLLFHTSVPTVFFGVPIAIGTVMALFGLLTQAFANGAIIIFASHGIAESLTVLFVHYPYRNYIKNLFGVGEQLETDKSYAPTGINNHRVIFRLVPQNLPVTSSRFFYLY